MNHAYLLIGGNIGDRHANLSRAVNNIESVTGSVLKQSSVYETAPWGFTAQPSFLNQVLLIETVLSADLLLDSILGIEEKMGRKRLVKMGPRIIDIDILFYNDQIINTASLTIPHPEITNRRFVLAPLNEIAPSLIHPVMIESISSLLLECKDDSVVTKV